MTMTVTRPAGTPYSRFRWDEAVGIWSARVTPYAGQSLRMRAPIKTGALRQGIKSREEPSPGALLIIFYTTLAYAPYILGGTRPHVIAAKNAKALRWVAHSGHGPVMFAKSVKHPGTKPNPFPDRAVGPLGGIISQLFADAVREAMDL